MHTRHLCIFAGLLCLLCTTAGTVKAQHPAINLLDREGEIIDPINGENEDKPISTAMTCGMCHDYEEITSGYHFQMGWDVISDDFGSETGEPWNLSDGFMGKWYPYAFRQLAKKANESPDEIDLTVYDFVGFSNTRPGDPPCGACHPGGGGLEYDREGNRYDEYLEENPELRDELDGDYYKSHWDKSGVVEADCFVCHFEGYNFDERVAQLRKGNYRWASLAGTRIGFVEGSVKNGDEPTVKYNRRFFNDDGTITLHMSWPPPSDNCVFCHGSADVRKRGFSWNDIFNPDVHNQQGISCTACHPAGPDHQIAKGDANVSTVADHLDGEILDCRECHESGYLGASIPRHTKVRPSHLQRISCEGCHIPSLNRSSALGSECSSGMQVFETNPIESDGFGENHIWYPSYERHDDGVINPINSVQGIWWANMDADSIIHPLFLKEHKIGWELFSESVTDDNGDGVPEVNRDEEILAGLKAFSETLQGNDRFTEIHPVLIKGNKAYHLNENGQVAVMDREIESSVNFSINHTVAPARLALGEGGCLDCHDRHVHFFKGQRVVDLYAADGQPETVSNGRYYGCNPVSFAINSFHQEILSPIVSVGIILVVFLVTVHYHSYGPKHLPFVPYSGEVKRFSLGERGLHLFRLISFLLLTGTGLIIAFAWSSWQELFFRSPHQMLWTHIIAGIVFIITTVIGIAVWFKDALFSTYDKEWVKRIGGYLGYKGEVPAGRFNAGQKMFYWYTAIFGLIMSVTGVILIFKNSFPLSVICIISTIHNLFGFIMIAGVLSHAYLGTIANPGTWRVLVDGYVTRIWAEHHHPLWFLQMKQQGRIHDEEEGETDASHESASEENDSSS